MTGEDEPEIGSKHKLWWLKMIVTFDDRGVTEAMNGGGVGLLLPSNLSQRLCLGCCYLTTPPASARLCFSSFFFSFLSLSFSFLSFFFSFLFLYSFLSFLHQQGCDWRECLPQLQVSATDNVILGKRAACNAAMQHLRLIPNSGTAVVNSDS